MDQIWAAHINIYDQMFGEQLPHWHVPQHANKPDLVLGWIEEHFDWLHNETETLKSTDPYWSEVDLILSQFRGLHKGYNDHCGEGQGLSETAFFMLQMDGDLEAVIPMLSADPKAATKPMETASAVTDVEPNAKCSALIRLAPGNADLFVGHDTWDSYGSMNRAYKHYDFALKGKGSRQVSMSSSPAYLSSVDDFYITGNGRSVYFLLCICASHSRGTLVLLSLLSPHGAQF